MGREGWEDGTPPPHRDVKERCVVRWPSPTLGSLPLPISLRSLSPLLAATFMPPRGRPTLVVLSLVISSSVASFSSASSCAAAACRSFVLSASFAFRRNSVLLAAYPGPSSLSSSPRARTTFLTPPPIICLQVMLLLRSTLSSNTRASTDDAGAGVPFGCIVPVLLPLGSSLGTFGVAHPPCRDQALYPPYILLSFLCPCLGLVVVSHPCLYGNRGAAFPTTCSSLVTSPASSLLFLSGMESVSAGSVQAITGAVLSYSSSASAPNLKPIAFKEAALARLRNVAVSFESGASRSTLAVALAVCLSSFRIKRRASSLFPAQLPLSMCANDACGGSLSSRVQSSQSLRSPILLLASRTSFVASSLAALHALHPQNALLVAGPLIPRFLSPSRIRLWCAPCGTPTCCLTLAPKIVLVVTL